VAEGDISAALEQEVRAHALPSARTYPKAPPTTWNPRIEATLASLGVTPEIISAARSQVLAADAKKALRSEKKLLSQASSAASDRDRVSAWKAAHPDKAAEYARAYRARKRLQVVPHG
jgi:hypothetical protein